MKLKNAALLLIICSSLSLLADFYWIFRRFEGSNFSYYKDHPVELLVSFSSLLIPVSLLILGLALNNHNPGNKNNDM